MDILTSLLLIAVIWMGMKYGMIWLSVISGFLLIAYVMGGRTQKPLPVSTGKPKVRPIIVKRRYAGPASIYPSRMKIKVNPKWNTNNWWENAFLAAGVGAGLLTQGFRPRN